MQNRKQDNVTSDYDQPREYYIHGESSHGTSMESQLALDEALARSLELDDDFSHLYISDPGSSTVGKTFIIFEVLYYFLRFFSFSILEY